MSTMITGGTGFLGSYLARHMVQEKGVKDLVLFERYPNRSRIAEVEDQVTVVEGDVLEPQEILEAMERYNVDRVIHLAFILGGAAKGKVVPYLRIQCMGTANVFEAARIHGIKRVVYASSLAVYGRQSDQSMNEDEPTRPRGLYGAAKLWGEHVAEVYNSDYDMDIISLRPCSIFGLGRARRGSYATGLVNIPEIPHFMALPELAALGESITMPPDHQVADWIYAADMAEAWWLALNVESPPHRVYNVRSEQRPVGDYTEHLRRLLPDVQISVSDKTIGIGQIMDNTLLVKELGFKAQYTMETGLEDYVNRIRRDAGLPEVKPV